MQDWKEEIEKMIESQIVARGIHDVRVLQAMRKVPRHLFVEEEFEEFAYDDRPLPIGFSQTISQPYIVAYMTLLAQVTRHDKVLEIGLGSGYQSAVLAQLADHVYSVEIVKPLFDETSRRLLKQGYTNITPVLADGSHGLPQFAPYDVIMATAAPRTEIPAALIDQLGIGGRLILPLGYLSQHIYRITRSDAGIRTERLLAVKFVAMTGDAA